MGFEIKPPSMGRVWIFSRTAQLREKGSGWGGGGIIKLRRSEKTGQELGFPRVQEVEEVEKQ